MSDTKRVICPECGSNSVYLSDVEIFARDSETDCMLGVSVDISEATLSTFATFSGNRRESVRITLFCNDCDSECDLSFSSKAGEDCEQEGDLSYEH